MPTRENRKQAAARNEVFVTVRLPADLYDDLCRVAKRGFRTASSEARLAIYQHVITSNDQEGETE